MWAHSGSKSDDARAMLFHAPCLCDFVAARCGSGVLGGGGGDGRVCNAATRDTRPTRSNTSTRIRNAACTARRRGVANREHRRRRSVAELLRVYLSICVCMAAALGKRGKLAPSDIYPLTLQSIQFHERIACRNFYFHTQLT